MERNTKIAIGLNLAILAGFGVWLFGQDPLPEQLVKPKSDVKRQIVQTEGAKQDSQSIIVTRSLNAAAEENTIPSAGLRIPGQGAGSAGEIRTLVLTGTSIRMREGPTSASSHLATYGTGDTFQKLGEQGKWVQVRNLADGAEGWIYGKYLEPDG